MKKICSICKKNLSISRFYKLKPDPKNGHPKSRYYFCCSSCNKIRHKIWYQNNKEVHLKRALEKTKKEREECIKLLGNKCKICSIRDKRVLCIDHVNGDGNIERKNKKMGGQMYNTFLKKIKSGSKSYQILCRNCNWIKALENKELYKKF